MGYSITWCAVPEGHAEALLAHLKLSPTGEVEEIPESPVSNAKLDTGWRILWCNKYAWPLLRANELSEISKNYAVLMCLVEEHVMASSSELWSGGKREWWISHEGENGPKGLSFDGVLPDCFSTIKSQMEKAQLAEGGEEADVDYIFEIPLKVAQTIVGFKHDEDCPHMVDGHFSVLSEIGRKKGFLQNLLGR